MQTELIVLFENVLNVLLRRFVTSVRSKQPLSVPVSGSIYSDGQYSILPTSQDYRATEDR